MLLSSGERPSGRAVNALSFTFKVIMLNWGLDSPTGTSQKVSSFFCWGLFEVMQLNYERWEENYALKSEFLC